MSNAFGTSNGGGSQPLGTFIFNEVADSETMGGFDCSRFDYHIVGLQILLTANRFAYMTLINNVVSSVWTNNNDNSAGNLLVAYDAGTKTLTFGKGGSGAPGARTRLRYCITAVPK